jgi:CRISPR/Cas system-associated endonuclease Cas3-HD
MTVDALRQDYPEVGNRLKKFVVLACVHHLDKTNIMSLPLSQLELPEPTDILLSETKSVLIEMAKNRKLKGASKMTKETLVVR